MVMVSHGYGLIILGKSKRMLCSYRASVNIKAVSSTSSTSMLICYCNNNVSLTTALIELVTFMTNRKLATAKKRRKHNNQQNEKCDGREAMGRCARRVDGLLMLLVRRQVARGGSKSEIENCNQNLLVRRKGNIVA